MKKYIIIFTLLFCDIWNVHSQSENNIWLLNQDMTLNFNVDPPFIYNENNSMTGNNESCVVVSDFDSGQLLFYSDGIQIWNKNHHLMDSSETTSENFLSTAQGVIAVKSAQSKGKYYLFSLESADENGTGSSGRLFMTDIDMNANNGEGREIGSKIIGDQFTEQMVATAHPCGGIWLITHQRNSDTYVASHIVENNVLKMVETNIGRNLSNNLDYVGSFSINKKNVLINLNASGIFEILKFDLITGKFRELMTISQNATKPFLHGIFSPNDSLFYLVTGDANTSWLEQYDISNYDEIYIKTSKNKLVTIPNQYSSSVYKFALGKDDKIYYTTPYITSSLGVINYPNLKGSACDFQPLQLVTPNYSFNKSLPTPLVFSTPILKDFLPADTSFCTLKGNELKPSVSLYDSLRWSDGQSTSSISITTPGQYSLTLYENGCAFHDTIIIGEHDSGTLDLGSDISICRAESHTISIPTQTGDQILWSDGNTETSRNLTNPGKYSVSITTTDGCVISDSITISRSYNKIPKTTTIDLCQGKTYTYKGINYAAGTTIVDSIAVVTGCDTLLTISLRDKAAPIISRDTATCDNTPIIISNKTYEIGDTIYLTKASLMGCDTLVQMVYRYHQGSIRGVQLQDTLVCKGNKTTATIMGSSLKDVHWSNGDSTRISTFGPGNHFVQAKDDRGCVRKFPFEIKAYPSPKYEKVVVEPRCNQQNGSIAIRNLEPSISFDASLNGMETDSLGNLGLGSYKIVLTDINGCETKDSIILTKQDDLQVTLVSNVTGVIGQIVSIAYHSSGGNIDTIIFNPKSDINRVADSILVAIAGDRVYSITFIDEHGCTVTKILTISASLPPNTLVLPNIVTLQSNNVDNSIFYLKTEGVTYDMRIYDRWGNLIHAAQKSNGGDASQAWYPQKSKVTQGVYVYVVTIYTDDGVITKFGSVTVM